MRKLLCLLLLGISIMLNAQTSAEAELMHKKAIEYLSDGKVKEGRDYALRAMDMRKSITGEINSDYILSLNAYAMSFFMEKDYHKAEELQRKILSLCCKLNSPDPKLGMYNMNLGKTLYILNNYKESAVYIEKGLSYYKDQWEPYNLALNILGLIYNELNDIENSTRILELSKEFYSSLPDDSDNPDILILKAAYYSTYDKPKAKALYMKLFSMDLTDKTLISAYNNYVSVLSDERDFSSAAEYKEKAAMLQLKIDDIPTEYYISLLYQAGLFYYISGQYNKCIATMQKRIEAIRQISGKFDKYAECYHVIGNSYMMLRQFDKANDMYMSEIALFEKNDTSKKAYPKALLSSANMFKHTKQFDKAIPLYEKAIALFKQMGMSNDYSGAVSSLTFCNTYVHKDNKIDSDTIFIQKGRKKQVEEMLESELANLENIKNHLDKLTYASSLRTIAGLYKLKGDMSSAVDYYDRHIVNVRQAYMETFQILSEDERGNVWEDEISTINELKDGAISIKNETKEIKERYAAMLYDVNLLYKGILLNSSIEFARVLQTMNDDELNSMYKKLKDNTLLIANLRSKDYKSNSDKILSLSQENQRIQLKMYDKCSEFADYTDYISYSWKDVQKNLQDGDLAIEFTTLGENAFLSENYMAAVVLTSSMKVPEIVYLCHLDEARNMVDDAELFNKEGKVWGYLEEYLEHSKRIFFSADGDFNRVGIEYLKYKGCPLSDQFEVYRMSSTKELCFKRKKYDYNNAILFGDVNYNNFASVNKKTDSEVNKMRSNDFSSEWSDLSATYDEIVGIEKILRDAEVANIAKYTNTDASVSAFKNINDTKVNILHIATHGQFINEKSVSDKESMKNSMLVFAGANIDKDNVVTAADVAGMNLRQCDLVVLSACETGLGKLGSDGVFGLQRGFKNAGIHTILMSLKKVYDKSTAEFMQYFYKHLFNGMSKREAFVRAQKDLRDNGYNDPKYWAAFILLDAY